MDGELKTTMFQVQATGLNDPLDWTFVPGGEEYVSKVGPMYYKDYFTDASNINGGRSMDTYYSFDAEQQIRFEFPAYDGFSYSGPGAGGAFRGFMFDSGILLHDIPDDVPVQNYRKFESEMYFRPLNDLAVANSPEYLRDKTMTLGGQLTHLITSDGPQYLPNGDPEMVWMDKQFYPLVTGDAENFTGDFINNQLRSSTYIRHYTKNSPRKCFIL